MASLGWYIGLGVRDLWCRPPYVQPVHDRLSPPLRPPPRPKRKLGGTNLRADIVEVRSSTSGSGEEKCGGLLLVALLLAAANGSEVFAGIS